MSIIIPIPSDDNGNLMKILASQNLEFTVTNASFSSVMALIYNPPAKTSPPSKSKTAKTVIVNAKIFVQMLCLIVPIPSDDNCKLVELLASLNLEFTVTNSSFSSVMALIYNPTAKPSPPSKSKTAKTVIINGNTEIHSKLATNGYSNYSVTVKSYYEVVSQLF